VAATARAPREPKDPKTCHERALGLLAVRPRSRRELELRLTGAGFERQEVAEVLGRLERVGLIDDESFARAVAEHAFGTRRSGAMAVRRALGAKGVAGDTVDAVVAELGDGEEERAVALARSRVGRLAGLPPQTAFGRLVGLLARRGYTSSVARQAARLALDVDEEGVEP
jgi:regulatory protein